MSYHHSWIEISKENLIHNIKAHYKFLDRGVNLSPVVKSNAYGHGMVLVSQVLDKMKEVGFLSVVNLEEAIVLRKNKIKKPILVLSYYGVGESKKEFGEQIKFVIKNDISLMVYDLDQIKLLDSAAKKLNKKIKVHIKVETGMARVGVPYDKALNFIKRVNKFENIKINGLASHFATTEESNQYFAKFQLNNFKSLIKELDKLKIDIPIKHMAASAAITLSKENHFNAVRLGIAMYGLWPSKENQKMINRKYPKFKLRPVLSWKTKLFQIKELKPDSPVGYGCTYRTTKNITMGLIPVGYYEGLDRKFSNKGYVLIKGQKCPIIGAICMNISIIDISKVSNPKVGEEVILIGKSAKKEIKANDLALIINTINYELVTRLNSEIHRKLIK
jgi:alanine racemase